MQVEIWAGIWEHKYSTGQHANSGIFQLELELDLNTEFMQLALYV